MDRLRIADKKIDEKIKLPWVCPDHPNAKVLVSWDEKHSVMNGYPSGLGVRFNYKWECYECGRELAGKHNAFK